MKIKSYGLSPLSLSLSLSIYIYIFIYIEDKEIFLRRIIFLTEEKKIILTKNRFPNKNSCSIYVAFKALLRLKICGENSLTILSSFISVAHKSRIETPSINHFISNISQVYNRVHEQVFA